jgi:hypothetical protein
MEPARIGLAAEREKLIVFAAGCSALVAEVDPVVAIDLNDTLTRLGCTVLGPVDSSAAGIKLLLRQRPNFALLNVSPRVDHFLPLAELLSLTDVPYAIFATVDDQVALSRASIGRDVPQLAQPFDPESLHQLARGLYRTDLELKLKKADQRIAAGISRIAHQVRKVEQLAAASYDESRLAEFLLCEIIHAVHLMRTTRALLAERLEMLA